MAQAAARAAPAADPTASAVEAPGVDGDSFAARAREWGLRRALYWRIMRTLSKRLGFHVHYVHIGADRPDLRSLIPPEVPPAYETRMARKSDFLPFAGRIPEVDRDFLDEVFDRIGDECSVTLLDGEPVSFCFVTRVRARVTPQLDVIVPQGFRYVYKTWTHPAHRRCKLSSMGSFVRNVQQQRPFAERSISYVETHNYASLLHGYRRPAERAIRFGLIGWFTVFGRQVPFRTRAARWTGIEFVRKGGSGTRYYAN